MKLHVPRAALPQDPHEREAALRTYFAQLVVRATEVANGWELALEWTSQDAMYIDPGLAAGLDWWSQNYGPISIAEIPTSSTLQDRFLLAVEDAWTLCSWSRWLKNTAALPSQVTVLHLDDHNDLMSPRVVVEPTGWIDAITSATVDLREPVTVAAAIRSGAVGIGSFIAPFVHAMPRVDIRHLCARRYARAGPPPCRLMPVMESDTLLAPGRPRLAVKAESSSPPDGTHRYQATDDLDVWLDAIAPGPVLLHVDMDYFNNRYDGDSDWRMLPDRYDPPLEFVLARIDEVFAALRSTGMLARIEDVAIALSPGFFPADLWPQSIERVKRHLHGKRQ